jgi:hypothetical protein
MNSSEDGKMSRSCLLNALQTLGIPCISNEEELDSLFLKFDCNKDGLIDFEEFKAVVKAPTAAEAWAMGIAWWQPIADAVPVKVDEEPLRTLAGLTREQMDCLCEVVQRNIGRLLREQVNLLRVSVDAMTKRSVESEEVLDSSKFKVFKASAGKTREYHQGLTGRIGKYNPDMFSQFATYVATILLSTFTF